MLLSWKWLNDFVSLSCTPQEAAQRLTESGSEIESLRRADEGVSGILIGKIIEHTQHPTKSGLTVTRVDVGDGNPRLVVTAAKNVKLGDTIAYAISGSRVKSGMTLGFRDFDGFESDGMMCSAAELGVPDLVSEPGILILPDGAPLGADVIRWLGLDDWILELSITPNRGDLLSYLGVARELCALFEDAQLKPLNLKAVGTDAPLPQEISAVKLHTPLCAQYDLAYVESLKPEGTPLQDQVKLVLSGMRPINPVVDATNLTMLALGQPLHAFDLDKLQGPISVRQGEDGSTFTTLDGKERTIVHDDLMIYAGDEPVALAGVMGGMAVETDASTKRVIVESARFDAPSVMKTSRRLGLSSEAAYRMARGIDPLVLEPALAYFTSLLEQWGCGKAYSTRLSTVQTPYEPRSVSLRLNRLEEVSGEVHDAQKVKAQLRSLGLTLLQDGDEQVWQIPSWRLDVSIEEDLIEEVTRLEGYNGGKRTIPQLHQAGQFPQYWKAWRALRDGAIARGFVETVTFSFLSPNLIERLDYPDPSGLMNLANPLSADLSTLRPLILPSLLSAAERATKRGWRKTIRLFEVGRVFQPIGDEISEGDHLCGLVCAPIDARSPYSTTERIDFFTVKGDLEALLLSRGLKASYRQALLPWAHRGQCAEVVVDGHVIGAIAQVKPIVLERFDLRTEAYYFELDMEALSREPMPQYQIPGDYPPSYRDVAFLTDLNDAADSLAQWILTLGAPLAKSVRLFDLYQGQGIPEGKKSLAFSICYQDPTKTLTDAEVEECHQKVRQGLADEEKELR